MIAVGGWGDDVGWQTISQSDTAIYQFAGDVATMLKNTGADGVGKVNMHNIATNTYIYKISTGSILGETAQTINRFRMNRRKSKSMPIPKFSPLFGLLLRTKSYRLLYLVERVSDTSQKWFGCMLIDFR